LFLGDLKKDLQNWWWFTKETLGRDCGGGKKDFIGGEGE